MNQKKENKMEKPTKDCYCYYNYNDIIKYIEEKYFFSILLKLIVLIRL